jgi:hypothetical protein
MRCAEPIEDQEDIVIVHSAFKTAVRTFAALNSIKYTAALREFDEATGRLRVSTRGVTPGPSRAAEDQWAEARALVRTEPHGCFHQLASDSGRGGHGYKAYQMDCSFQDDMDTLIKDHARAFLYQGPSDSRRRLAAVTFAPYRGWDNPRVREELRLLATEHDLSFRVGMLRDATYGSGTIPIVIWNPRVLDLA